MGYVGIWRNSIPGNGNSKCKSPEVGVYLACSRDARKGADMARVVSDGKSRRRGASRNKRQGPGELSLQASVEASAFASSQMIAIARI